MMTDVCLILVFRLLQDVGEEACRVHADVCPKQQTTKQEAPALFYFTLWLSKTLGLVGLKYDDDE